MRVYFDGVFFFLFVGIIGGTPDKCFYEDLFGFFLRGIIGGTPDKRISEGLFCPLFFLLVLGFYRYYRGDP